MAEPYHVFPLKTCRANHTIRGRPSRSGLRVLVEAGTVLRVVVVMVVVMMVCRGSEHRAGKHRQKQRS
jgi:hypothetical protein